MFFVMLHSECFIGVIWPHLRQMCPFMDWIFIFHLFILVVLFVFYMVISLYLFCRFPLFGVLCSCRCIIVGDSDKKICD